ncbi:MAG: GIY-YIG nuclease family protein [Rhodocyclaceae bacterium]|nr:MAG: GIY-YIG nuclease family protein [Rhodocyclaceae bacterium]
MAPHCTYQLLIEVVRPLTVPVGRFGPCRFAAGRYVYTGSAKRNFEARITRHLGREKKLRWHIDYLLAAAGVAVVGVRRYGEEECDINQRMPGAIAVPGFGASDCRHGCGGHLKYLGK